MLNAACANDFKHAALTSLKAALKVYNEYYIIDYKNEIFAFELYEDGRKRIVENPWYEGNRLVWSNTYDSEHEQDKEKNPWTMFSYPIRFSTDWEEIRVFGSFH